jgi:hypothetical protein
MEIGKTLQPKQKSDLKYQPLAEYQVTSMRSNPDLVRVADCDLFSAMPVEQMNQLQSIIAGFGQNSASIGQSCEYRAQQNKGPRLEIPY